VYEGRTRRSGTAGKNACRMAVWPGYYYAQHRNIDAGNDRNIFFLLQNFVFKMSNESEHSDS